MLSIGTSTSVVSSGCAFSVMSPFPASIGGMVNWWDASPQYVVYEKVSILRSGVDGVTVQYNTPQSGETTYTETTANSVHYNWYGKPQQSGLIPQDWAGFMCDVNFDIKMQQNGKSAIDCVGLVYKGVIVNGVNTITFELTSVTNEFNNSGFISTISPNTHYRSITNLSDGYKRVRCINKPFHYGYRTPSQTIGDTLDRQIRILPSGVVSNTAVPSNNVYTGSTSNSIATKNVDIFCYRPTILYDRFGTNHAVNNVGYRHISGYSYNKFKDTWDGSAGIRVASTHSASHESSCGTTHNFFHQTEGTIAFAIIPNTLGYNISGQSWIVFKTSTGVAGNVGVVAYGNSNTVVFKLINNTLTVATAAISISDSIIPDVVNACVCRIKMINQAQPQVQPQVQLSLSIKNGPLNSAVKNKTATFSFSSSVNAPQALSSSRMHGGGEYGDFNHLELCLFDRYISDSDSVLILNYFINKWESCTQ